MTMQRSIGAVTRMRALLTVTVVVTALQCATVSSSFFVCPSPCEAMALPRDMENMADCVCPEHVVVQQRRAPYHCPPDSAGTRILPQGFEDCQCLLGFTRDDSSESCSPVSAGELRCLGRYRPMPDQEREAVLSIADCDCRAPYRKDPSDDRGRCLLQTCPRGGNYVRGDPNLRQVSSLADCECLAPYRKNAQSGECMATPPAEEEEDGDADADGDGDGAGVYECPPLSLPTPNRQPRSFADCHCDWGFVRTETDTCARESAAYACPPNAMKSAELSVGESPRGFADCECVADGKTARFIRNEDTQTCDRIATKKSKTKKKKKSKDTKKTTRKGKDAADIDTDATDVDGDGGEAFTCPIYSRPLAPHPRSVEQCACIDGYGWKTPQMTCVRLSSYQCPPHSFRLRGGEQSSTSARAKTVEESFADCECARGYYRDTEKGLCLQWFLVSGTSCPMYSYLRHWPLQSRANCQCVYGLAPPPTETSALPDSEEEEKEAIDEDEDPDVAEKKLRARLARQRRRKHMAKRKRLQQQMQEPYVPGCIPPPQLEHGDDPIEFLQCPNHAYANTWPMERSDCTCEAGYTRKTTRTSLFECVEVVDDEEDEKEDADGEDDGVAILPEAPVKPQCRRPSRISRFNGECRLPMEEVRPTDSRQDTGVVLFRGIEYAYVLAEENTMIVQGDVAIGERVQWSELLEESDAAGDASLNVEETHVLHGYFNSERDHRWRDASMCFEIGDSARGFDGIVTDAMDHLTAVTQFRFTRCANDVCAMDAACASDYVSVQRTASSCFSSIGRVGGRQLLGISKDCGVGNLMHVLLHAVGLHHAVDREDRDAHVRVAWECVPADKRSMFVVENPQVDETDAVLPMDTPYDFYSIMHHPADAFVRSVDIEDNTLPAARRMAKGATPPPWCNSLFPLIENTTERVAVLGGMGQRERLAVTDIHAVWKLYPQLQTLQMPGYLSETETTTVAKRKGVLPQVQDVHESRVHSTEDLEADEGKAATMKSTGRRSLARKIGSFVGAIMMLVGFAAFMAFGVVELRRRSLQSSDEYFSESLLADRTAIPF